MKVVYFVKPKAAGGPIKIGVASNLKKRMSSLLGGSPLELEVIVSVEGDGRLERQFHARFMPHHSHGEWFHPVPELLETIAALKAGTFDLATLPKGQLIQRGPRNLGYITPRWNYKCSVLAQLRNVCSRGADVRYDERSLSHTIMTADEAAFAELRQELDPQIAALVAAHPSATTLRRQRKVLA